MIEEFHICIVEHTCSHLVEEVWNWIFDYIIQVEECLVNYSYRQSCIYWISFTISYWKRHLHSVSWFVWFFICFYIDVELVHCSADLCLSISYIKSWLFSRSLWFICTYKLHYIYYDIWCISFFSSQWKLWSIQCCFNCIYNTISSFYCHDDMSSFLIWEYVYRNFFSFFICLFWNWYSECVIVWKCSHQSILAIICFVVFNLFLYFSYDCIFVISCKYTD